MLVPVGCKSVPEGITCPNDLLAHGWRLERVGLAPERIHPATMGKKGKRHQYGLCHRVSSTIHAVMGSDLGHVATKLSLTDPLYRLWEKEQAVVMLYYFCGQPQGDYRCNFAGDSDTVAVF